MFTARYGLNIYILAAVIIVSTVCLLPSHVINYVNSGFVLHGGSQNLRRIVKERFLSLCTLDTEHRPDT